MRYAEVRVASLSLAALLLGATQVLGQQHHLRFLPDQELPGRLRNDHTLRNVAALDGALGEMRALLYAKGYLEASMDSCTTRGDTTTCPLRLGTVYRWAHLSRGNVGVEIASQARFREKLYRDEPVTPRQVGRLVEGLLDLCENTGHPFAELRLDSIRSTGDGLHASLHLDQGRLVLLDSIVVRGTARTSDRYLYNYIGLEPGDPYNERAIMALRRRLREIPFVQVVRAPYVQFTEERTKLFLFLDDKKASSITGILGVQPDPVTGDVIITGDLDLKLKNALRRGENIALNWRRLRDRTQELILGFNYPFLLNTPFGTDLGLRIFRRDTTFLEVNAHLAVELLLQQGDKLSFILNNKSSDRLGTLTQPIPGLADVKVLSYGLALARERFDYRLNPRSGHSAVLSATAGRKRTNTAVFGDTGPTEKRTVQYQLDGKAVAHLRWGSRGTIRTAAQGGWMINDDLFANELYRIGGIKTMRGADEASIFASAFAIGTVELRYLYEENANFFVFVDQGWWENAAADQYLKDDPLGFGLGTSFETKAGIFSLTYALGQQFGNPLELRSGKIHFGFISLF